MAKIYVSLEFDGGDLSFQRELRSWTGTDRQVAFTLVLQALNVYLQAFTPEMRHAWDDLAHIRQLFLIHTEDLPVPSNVAKKDKDYGRVFLMTSDPIEPSDVTVVEDNDGDRWIRNSDNLWKCEGDSIPDHSWKHLLHKFGPLTEVRKDT
jgi:hypothetical protein